MSVACNWCKECAAPSLMGCAVVSYYESIMMALKWACALQHREGEKTKEATSNLRAHAQQWHQRVCTADGHSLKYPRHFERQAVVDSAYADGADIRSVNDVVSSCLLLQTRIRRFCPIRMSYSSLPTLTIPRICTAKCTTISTIKLVLVRFTQ